MGLGKWIVGGIAAAVAAPFVLPAAAVTAVGSAVAAGVGAVTAGAAAVGGAVATGAAAVGAGAVAAGSAIAGLGSAALAAASAIGATTLIGGITIATAVKAAGLVLVGIIINESDAADRETKAYERGLAHASKEYEAKLRKQANAFLNLLAEAEKNNAEYKRRAETAEAIAWQAIELTKEFEGCIVGLQKQGRQIDTETAGYYQHLKEVRTQIRTSKAA